MLLCYDLSIGYMNNTKLNTSFFKISKNLDNQITTIHFDVQMLFYVSKDNKSGSEQDSLYIGRA